jgi:SAM-dependent methyltransferase
MRECMENIAHATNQRLIDIITRTQIDPSFAYRGEELADLKLQFLADHCEKVLDIGKSSRDRFRLFRQGQIVTLDLNQYEGYPDIVDDLCDLKRVAPESFDGIICNAVLEHVYDPHRAVQNLYQILTPGGFLYGHAPFLYRYHAPESLAYQDFYRYTKDGLAYLFRDFREVTLYPCRGRISTVLALFARWKFVVEKLSGQRLNRLVDWFCSQKQRFVQVSGHFIWAIK